jgi:hypothetical protein
MPAPGSIHPGDDIEVIDQAKRLFGMLAGTRAVLAGTVTPARKGDTVTLEVRAGPGWHKLGKVRLGKGGAFAVRTPAPGLYRTVYRGLDGPAVNVG